MRKLWRVGAALMTCAVLLGVAASAQAVSGQLPVGQAQGVRVDWRQGAMVVVFTKPAAGLYKRIAGREVVVSCWHIRDSGGDGGGVRVRAPKRGRRLETGDLVRDWDYCRVWRRAWTVKRRSSTTYHSRELIVSVPLTQKGAAFLDEHDKALALSWLLISARRPSSPPSPNAPFLDSARLVTMLQGTLRTFFGWPGTHPLVALSAPDQTPPAGAVGYFSDGEKHAAAVAVSDSGRRLFIEFAPDDVLHTNVTKYLFQRFR